MTGQTEIGTPLSKMMAWGRLAADGIVTNDLLEAAELNERDQWMPFWSDKGEEYAARAESAAEAGHTITAGRWFWYASMCFHVAQFYWFHDPPVKEAAQRRKQELYQRAAPHLVPPAERFDLPFEDTEIPGYVRRPLGEAPAGGWPFVLCIGGGESTKEESLLMENMLLERGMGTVTFDGPGQGEFRFQKPMVTDFHRYGIAVTDHMAALPDCNPDRLGIIGRSLGGFYMFPIAINDGRFKAGVSWGGIFDHRRPGVDTMPPAAIKYWSYVTEKEGADEVRAFLKEVMDLGPIADKLNFPVLAQLGNWSDHNDVGPGSLDEMRDSFPPGLLQVEIVDGGIHCSHNMGEISRPPMADWLADKLVG